MNATLTEFKVTYYVGVMLAHGGVLSIKEDRLVFAPGAVERAVGAADTVIPFSAIKNVEVTGTITESLMVKTTEKAHRFVGGEPYKIRDRIHQAIQVSYAVAPAAPAVPAPTPVSVSVSQPTPPSVLVSSSEKCPSCPQPIKADFNFCPNCKSVLRPVCLKCFKPIQAGWKSCAYCSASFS